jgi:hypothetical protein
MMPAVEIVSVNEDAAPIMWLAGPIAEMRFCPPLLDPQLERGDASDLSKVLRLLEARHHCDYTAPVVRRSLELLCERAWRLVDSHWLWITRVARMLSLWRRLSGREINALR